MKRASADTRSAAPGSEDKPSHLLCAYSPRWLSGPTPGYEGLCPTWGDDDPETAEHEAVTIG